MTKIDKKQLLEMIKDTIYEVLEEEIEKKLEEVKTQKLNEKWNKDVEVKKTGEHADKTIAQLKKQLNAIKAKEKKTEADKKLEHELVFAIRAKGGWKKGEGATK
jgi:hypothetical protein